jgi:hypothetical protein
MNDEQVKMAVEVATVIAAIVIIYWSLKWIFP